MSKFRWGILGTGGIARAFAHDLAFLEDHEVVAVGSRTIESAREFAKEFPTATAFESYESAVRAECDAIYVATPHTFHLENSVLALNAGKPVLCEKALTVNADQARDLVDRARELKLTLQEAMWTRFLPHIKEVRAIVESGELGEIITVIADHGQLLTPNPNPRLWDPALAGGALLDVGVYPVSFAHMVLGVPHEISASATLTDRGVDLQTSAIFTYDNGAHASLTSSFAARTSNTAVITGTRARIEIDSMFFTPSTFRVITPDEKVTYQYQTPYQGIGLREQAKVFADNVRSGHLESSEITHNQSIEVMESMDAIRHLIGVKYPEEI